MVSSLVRFRRDARVCIEASDVVRTWRAIRGLWRTVRGELAAIRASPMSEADKREESEYFLRWLQVMLRRF